MSRSLHSFSLKKFIKRGVKEELFLAKQFHSSISQTPGGSSEGTPQTGISPDTDAVLI